MLGAYLSHKYTVQAGQTTWTTPKFFSKTLSTNCYMKPFILLVYYLEILFTVYISKTIDFSQYTSVPNPQCLHSHQAVDLEPRPHIAPHNRTSYQHIEFLQNDRKRCTTIPEVRRFLVEKEKQFQQTYGSQFIALENISVDLFAKFETARDDFPPIRVLYDSSDDIVIVKFPSKQHEYVGSLFSEILHDQFALASLRLSDCMMPTLTGRQGFNNLQKEPDLAFIPERTRSIEDFPSIVVEIGVSESMSRLRQDAHIWLDKSDGWTNIVILISVDVSTRVITFERWQRTDRAYPRNSQSGDSARQIGSCVQIVVVNGQDGTVTGAPLHIPIPLLFDEVPNLPPNVSSEEIFNIPAAELTRLGTKVAEKFP